MDYKEKLEEAKRLYESANDEQKHIIENLFPELKESEDERIRKSLVSYLRGLGELEYPNKKTYNEWLEWLEKQGEQKPTNIVPIPDGCHAYIKDRKVYIENYTKTTPANKVESKFHKGDWITNGDYTWKIVEVKPLDYILQSQDGNIVDDTISHVDEQFHSFTIQDAKEGDVLYAKGFYGDCVFIFNGLDKWKFDEPSGDRAVATGHCCITISSKNIEFGTQGPDCVEVDTVNPATKEQRDLLFKKMKESGYDFDFETKELKKIDTYCQENCKGFQETGRCFCDGECKAKKEYIEQNLQENNFPQIEQKPAWSKEDDYNVQCLIAKVTYDIQKGNVGRNYKLIDWLKSLKYRMNND